MSESERLETGEGAPGLTRRRMLKGAAAAGVGAVAWAAPNIENLGFAPAEAQGTGIIILSPASDDKQSNSGNVGTVVHCDPDPGGPYPNGTCCGQAWGDNGKIDIFTFTNPIAGCSEIVVRTAPNASPTCDITKKNPDVGQSRIFISSTTGATCGSCTVLEGVIVASSGRTPLGAPLNNGPAACGGVDISIACNDSRLVASSRLAVRILCIV